MDTTGQATAGSGAAPARHAGWSDDIVGAAASMVAMLTSALSVGILAFAPLGVAFAEVGVFAGFAAAIYGQIVAALLGSTTHPGSGPRASTSLVLAGLVAVLSTDPALAATAHGPARIVAVAGFTVLLSGVFQMVLGVGGAGTLVRYVPYPFIAGFMCGASVLIMGTQLPPLAGLTLADLRADPARALGTLQPATLGVGAMTIGVVWACQRWAKRVPALLAGLVAGVVAYFALRAALPGVALGPVVGSLPAGLPLPTALLSFGTLESDVRAHLGIIVSTAAVLALIGSLDTLLAMVSVDHAIDGRHDARRELIAHGAANIASGLCGGVPVAYSRGYAMASWEVGARHPRTAVIGALMLAAVVLVAAPLIARIPVAALAGLMIMMAVGLIDKWASGLVSRLRAGEARDRTVWLSMFTVAAVAITTVVSGFVPAIAVGLLLSALLFIVGMNRSLVRSVVDGTVRPSRRVWGGQDAQRLTEVRKRIRVVELEGALFFGSAERLAEAVEPLAGHVETVILDFRHVSAMDATGALMVERLARRVAKRGTRLLLAAVTAQGRHGKAFLAHNAFLDEASRPWFHDADQAIEWAEQRGLDASGRLPLPEIPLAETDLLAGLAPDALAEVQKRLVRRTVAAGETLFREGDPGDRLCLIAHGAIEISIEVHGGRRARIVTMAEGAIFGEAALLDGRPRSATARAIEPSIVYELPREALIGDLAERMPSATVHVLLNVARVLSTRMRDTNEILRRLEESRG